MNEQKEKLEREMRELWEDYGNIGDEFLDVAHAVERDGEVSEESRKSVESLLSKSLDIAVRLQSVLWKGGAA